MTEKRFELKSWHFTDNMGRIYDRDKDETYKLSVYGIVDLLNEISQPEYDLKKFRDEICAKLDEIGGNE